MKRGVHELALFAGAGGGLLGSHLLGWSTVCAVEIDPYARSVLFARQWDGMLRPFPIWDDIRTFDGTPWRGSVDVVTGGFPCQDISSAGRREGLSGQRSGLWHEMLRVIGEVRPHVVFAENSPLLRTRGLQEIVQGLTEMGYCVRWGVLGAWHVGAPHKRNRMWIVAADDDNARDRVLPLNAEVASAPESDGVAANAGSAPLRQQPRRIGWQDGQGSPVTGGASWWGEARFTGVDDGVAHRVDRVRCTGNGQVPAVAALAWRVLGHNGR